MLSRRLWRRSSLDTTVATFVAACIKELSKFLCRELLPSLASLTDPTHAEHAMNPAMHRNECDTRQAEVYRAMTPAERLDQALRMSRQMRSLMDAGLRTTHPAWSAEQRQRVIADRILYGSAE